MSKAHERRTRESKDVRSTNPNAGNALHNHPLRNPDAPSHSPALDALRAQQAMLMRGDGWLRLTSDTDGKTIYLKYKWKSGNHRNKYVMVVATLDQLAWGLALLHTKCEKADTGEIRPTPDAAYNYDE